MITPAVYEDRMREIAENKDLASALAQVYMLMFETLDDLGYAGGNRVLGTMVSMRKQGDEHGA